MASIFGGAPRKLRSQVGQAVISLQGSSIAYTDKGHHQIWVMDANGDNARMVFENTGDELSALAWSPDGQRLAYLLGNNVTRSVHTVSLAGGAPSLVMEDDVNVLFALWWLPDGRILFSFDDGTNGVNLWGIPTNLKTGTPTGKSSKITNWPNFYLSNLSASSDGRRLTIIKGNQTSDVFVAEWKEKERRLDAPKNLGRSDADKSTNAWFRDGRAILLTSYRSRRVQISRLQLDSGSIAPLVPSPDQQFNPEISPDGAWILYWSLPVLLGHEKKLTTARVMRVSSSGGTPEPVAQYPPEAATDFNSNSLHCPRNPGSSCVLSRCEHDELTFFAFDALNGQGKTLTKTRMQAPNSLTWSVSPDGSGIAITSEDRLKDQIRILDVNKAIENNLQLPTGWLVQQHAWTPDGKALIVSACPEDCFLSYVDSNRRTHLLLSGKTDRYFGDPVFSSDGHYLAFTQQVMHNNVWLLENF